MSVCLPGLIYLKSLCNDGETHAGTRCCCNGLINVVEVRQRNLPLYGLLFLSPNDGSAALPWSLVPTAVVRFRAPAALGAVLDCTAFLEESEGGLLPQSLCGGKDHSFDEGRLPAAAAAGRGHACSGAACSCAAAADAGVCCVASMDV